MSSSVLKSAWQASEGAGNRNEECAGRSDAAGSRQAYILPSALILSSLPLYSLPRRLEMRWNKMFIAAVCVMFFIKPQ